MNRILTALIALSAIVGITACSSSNSSQTTSSNAPSHQEEKKAPSNASDVVSALKNDGLPIGKTVVYTAENDENKLLGRPGQYTSKVNFVDTRVKQEGNANTIDVSNGGSVEMFANEEDAKKRFDYVSNIAKSSPLLNEYDYINGKIVLRVSKELTPDQASAYENALKKISE